MIQEFLQVEKVFTLQLVVEVDTVQMSLNLNELDQRKAVDKLCKNCSVEDLYKEIGLLVDKIHEDSIEETQPPAITKEDIQQEEFKLWKTIEKSRQIEDFEYFLNKFPNGRYSNKARNILKELKYWREVGSLRNDIDDCSGNGSGKFYKAYNHMIFAPYGVDYRTGKLVHWSDEAKGLYKEGLIAGHQKDAEVSRALGSYISIPTTSTTAVLPFQITFGTSCVDYWSEGHPELNQYLGKNLLIIDELIAKGGGKELNALYKIFECPEITHKKISAKLRSKHSNIFAKSADISIYKFEIATYINEIIDNDPWIHSHCNQMTPMNNLIASIN